MRACGAERHSDPDTGGLHQGMNRAQRRRFDTELRTLLARDGDHCSLCRRPFEHNVRTQCGIAAGGGAAIAGPCCRSRIREVVAEGLFVAKHIADDLFTSSGDFQSSGFRSQQARAPEEPEQAVDELQRALWRGAQIAEGALRSAGLAGRARVTLRESPWKADDAAWFAARPNRSHRLRKAFHGELVELGGASSPAAGHEVQILVRQVEPGRRVRTQFSRNLSVHIPDDECALHALFDLAAGAEQGALIPVVAVRGMAQSYEATRRKHPH